jgi:hypothetical protein
MEKTFRNFWGAMHPDFDRLFIALWYIPLGIALHGAVVVTGDPTAYNYFGEGTYLPVYRYFFMEIVPQNVVFWATLALLFELTLGLLILSRGIAVKIGLLLSAIFQLLLAPTGVTGIVNVLLAIGCLMLLHFDYDQTIPELFVRWVRAHRV